MTTPVTKRALFDRMALSVISYLETFEDITVVDLQAKDEVSEHEIAIWERKNSPHKLPNDLRAFYSTLNGFVLSWKIDIGTQSTTIGEMIVNPLAELVPFPTDGLFMSNEWSGVHSPLPEPNKSTAFVLDSRSEVGDIVLLYSSAAAPFITTSSSSTEASPQGGICEPEIWFLDLNDRWHFLCPTFTHLMRIMVVHLGIIGWQMTFTPEGPPAYTKQWMSMFCKERLVLDLHWAEMLTNAKNRKLISLSGEQINNTSASSVSANNSSKK